MSSARTLLSASLLLTRSAAAEEASPSAPHQPSSPMPCAGSANAWRELCDPPYMLDATGIRRVLPECLTLPSVPTAAFELLPASATLPNAACEPPYHIDTRGVQRLLPECLSLALPAPLPSAIESVPAAPLSCELPYRIDAAGIRRLIAECVAVASSDQVEPDAPVESALNPEYAATCQPPYYIDEAGIRRLKRECL